MPSFYDTNQELTLFYPYMSIQNLIIEKDLEDTYNIIPSIQDQIENLNNLLYTIDFDIESPFIGDFIQIELNYIDSNYLSLHDYDNISDNDTQSRVIFSYLYELFTVDLLTWLLPNIIKYNNLKSCYDLVLLDSSKLKEYIFDSIKRKHAPYKMLKNTIKDDNLNAADFNNLKLTWFYDLFDTDLSSFQENVINDLIIKYDIELEANSCSD